MELNRDDPRYQCCYQKRWRIINPARVQVRTRDRIATDHKRSISLHKSPKHAPVLLMFQKLDIQRLPTHCRLHFHFSHHLHQPWHPSFEHPAIPATKPKSNAPKRGPRVRGARSMAKNASIASPYVLANGRHIVPLPKTTKTFP